MQNVVQLPGTYSDGANSILAALISESGQTGSSPVTATSGERPRDGKLGGIDFRVLPITVDRAHGKLLSASGAYNLMSETEMEHSWTQIQSMLKAGIVPSSERIKEYLASCCRQKNMEREIGKILNCIAYILRLEEERCEPTSQSMKDILFLIESDKSAAEIPAALSRIN